MQSILVLAMLAGVTPAPTQPAATVVAAGAAYTAAAIQIVSPNRIEMDNARIVLSDGATITADKAVVVGSTVSLAGNVVLTLVR